jgi:multiple sugar transport system ATP-binding protein
MSWIVFEKVGKKFGQKWTIPDLSLSIEKGEFFTLLGPSGCGKTTTLRLIAGLEMADQGKISIAGKDVTRLPPPARRIAMVFQNYALYPHMTVFENISYPLRIRKTAKDEIEKRVKESSSRLRIGHLLERMPSQISGGEQQRVAVCRAMVQEPNAFLFDEPLSNLDARLRLEARRFLRKIQKELGITAIYVTHDQAEAMAMSDRVAVMKEGRLAQVGSPEEIYHRPAELFVAGFVGNFPMNFIEGEALAKNGKLVFHSGDFEILLSDRPGVKSGDKITLAIRPEHIEISDSVDLKGPLEDIEELGSEQIVSISLSGKLILVRQTRKFSAKTGAQVALKIPQDSLHLFNQEGKRI